VVRWWLAMLTARLAILAASVGTAMAVAGCAQQGDMAPGTAASQAGSDCFNANTVNGFTALDDDTVDVQVGASRYYRLELAGVCPNVNWTRGVALVSRGSSWICHGLDAELVVQDPGLGPQRCLVSSVRRLIDAEVEALKHR
jgi:hypothetical protein